MRIAENEGFITIENVATREVTTRAREDTSHRCMDCGKGVELTIIHNTHFCTDCAEAIEIEMAAVTVLHSVEHLRDLKAKAKERADG